MTDTADTANDVETLLTQFKIEPPHVITRFLKLINRLVDKNPDTIKIIKPVLECLTTKLADAQAQLADAQAQLADLTAQLAEAQAQLAERPSTETLADSAQLVEARTQLAEARTQLAEARAEIERFRAQPHTQHAHAECSDRRVPPSKCTPTGLLAVNSCCDLERPDIPLNIDTLKKMLLACSTEELEGISTKRTQQYINRVSPVEVTADGDRIVRSLKLPQLKGILMSLWIKHINPEWKGLMKDFFGDIHPSNASEDRIIACIISILHAVQQKKRDTAVLTPEQPLPLALTN